METGPRFIVSIRRTGEARDLVMNQFKYGKLSFVVVEIDRYLTWAYSEGGQAPPPPPELPDY